jgi:putative hemolysin
MPSEQASVGNPSFDSFLSDDSLKFPLSILVPTRFRELYRKVSQAENQPIFEALLEEMKVIVNVGAADLARVPATGPTIAVANHPFGMLDGIVLGALLLRIRPDVKILTNHILAAFPRLREHCIFVDPFNGKDSKHANTAGLRRALSHLRDGGMLITFPAGEVSHWQFQHGEISDPQWTDTVARLVCATEASVLPVLFPGTNSLPFHLMGLIHPRLRTLRLPHELLNKFGSQVEVRIGNVITAEKISAISDIRRATDYLRWRTYLLGNRRSSTADAPLASRVSLIPRKSRAIAAPVRQELITRELESLGAHGCLVDNRDFAVYAAHGESIPNLLAEIGRQREITFREVGEGTGRAADLDRFDGYYTHLILWSKSKQELAGAYRLAATEEVLRSRGMPGLYTSSLFKFDARLFEQLGPALELGRSFIRSEYQKQYASLLMLWKGIGSYVARHPETPVLFGAVSISNSYKQASRELMVRFFEAQGWDPLAKFVSPKCSFRQRRKLRPWELSALSTLLDLDELSVSIAEIEEDGKGIPILLKQYLKVGGKILAFNVDKNFSNVLDGLILVDLRKTEPNRLELYMSKEGVESFRRYHCLPSFCDQFQAPSISSFAAIQS